MRDETIWLSQKSIATLFDVSKSTISRHLTNIFKEGELDEQVVVAEFATTTPHGAIAGKTQHKLTHFYNLDSTISVGYCVNSQRATHFRKWVTGVLKTRLKKSQPELTTRCSQLKMTAADGKRFIIHILNPPNSRGLKWRLVSMRLLFCLATQAIGIVAKSARGRANARR